MVLSRLDLLHALVVQHTFNIDAYQTNTVDKATSDGHFYCDKAPGTVFLALPSFYISTRILSAMGIQIDSEKGWFWSERITVLTSISALSAVGSVCLFLWLQGFVRSRCALLCTFVASFGSVMFPYSTIMMSHGLVIGLFAIALLSLRLGWTLNEESQDEHGFAWRDFLGGLACGMAVACEYDAGLVACGILIAVFAASRRRGCRSTVGAIPPLLLIPFYNWACVGNPLWLPYGHEEVFTEMHSGFYGIHAPNGYNVIHLTFSPERGLFFWTPFLLLAMPGYYFLLGRDRSMFFLCYLAPLGHVFVLSGYYTMEAGSTLGSRLLAPVVPLLILPAGIAASKMPRVALLLAILSMAGMGISTFVNLQMPSGEANPLFNYYLPQLLAGNLDTAFGRAMGLHQPWGALPVLLLVLAGLTFVWKRVAQKPHSEMS
jgi:hypothetical protein